MDTERIRLFIFHNKRDATKPEIVAKKRQTFLGLSIDVSNASESFRIIL